MGAATGADAAAFVEDDVAISLQRMGVETLDLLQFHWWDYDDAAYLDALTHLAELRDAGQMKHLALTNFDTAHLETITSTASASCRTRCSIR